MEKVELQATVEAILFASERPVTASRLQEVLGEKAPPLALLDEVLEALVDRYSGGDYGFEVRKAQGGFQFSTKSDYAQWVRRFLETKPFKLSRSALETLAVIAYRQPITRAEVDKVRGIDSSHLVRTLMEKGIIKMSGKADLPGRPVQYATTPKFLDLVGLSSPSELPPLSELRELEGEAPTKKDRIEDGMEKFIESQEVLDSRAEQLEEGLKDIDELIHSARKPSKEVYESPEQAEIAAENETAVSSFQSFSRGWKKPKAAKVDGEALPEAPPVEAAEPAPAAEDSPQEKETETSPG